MKENVGLGRTIYDENSGAFRRLVLTVQERIDLLHTLRDIHVTEMRECIEDAQLVLGKTAPGNLVSVACAFFERRAPATYWVYKEALDAKVHSYKNGNGGENHE